MAAAMHRPIGSQWSRTRRLGSIDHPALLAIGGTYQEATMLHSHTWVCTKTRWHPALNYTAAEGEEVICSFLEGRPSSNPAAKPQVQCGAPMRPMR